ncbi:MAG TPA: hypothetical protein P5081_21460 [Phycisphaerae bacterium]|nr:hypothetical protein [Phycisphaerae bacterium]HRW55449.1 hypothetical protein [Phycisphaerae bacterium]
MSRVLVHLTVLIALAMSSFVSAQDEMSMYPKRWYNGMQRTAGKYVEFITVAYGMDSELRQALINELDGRIRQQFVYMQDASQKLLQGPAANLKGLDLAKAIDAVYQDMPMNPDQVADWVNAYFPPDVAAIGHVRFKELLARDLRQSQKKRDDSERLVEVGKRVRAARAQCIATVNGAGQWAPAGVRLPAQSGAGEVVWSYRHADTQADNNAGGSARNEALPPLPCSDEWRAAAADICRQSQTRRPEQIAALWQEFMLRAWRRISMNSEVFTQLQGVASNREFAEILEQNEIQPDLDALFVEFRIRLEAIEADCRS